MGLLYIYGIHWFKCATGIGLETNNKEKLIDQRYQYWTAHDFIYIFFKNAQKRRLSDAYNCRLTDGKQRWNKECCFKKIANRRLIDGFSVA